MIEVSLQKQLRGAEGLLNLDVSFTVAPGETLALTGPSGAGKSSVLRMVAGLLRPDSGRVRVHDEMWYDGAMRRAWPPQRRRVGFLFQDYALFPHLTVRQNLTFAAVRADTFTDELLEATGLAALQHRRPAQLSGGQQQRAALARALVRRPPLLLLDEPFTALDAATRAPLQAALRTWQQRLGFAALLVSHDAALVTTLADRTLRLQDGRLASADGWGGEVVAVDAAAGVAEVRGPDGPLRVTFPPGSPPPWQPGDWLSLTSSGRPRKP